MKRNKLYIAVFIAVLLIVLSCGTVGTAFAYDGYIEPDMSPQELFSQTNTFDCTSVVPKTDTTDYHVTYDLNNRKENVQVMDTTQITVLTHGLDSHAGAWSNKYAADNTSVAFSFDSDSLIWKISEAAGGANVYWANMNGYEDFTLYDLVHPLDGHTTVPEIYSIGTESNLKKVARITDISKHIVVVFNSAHSRESNDNVYYEFNYMLSRIIYDVKYLNGGILPKVNLIGHSRGGLTNLQYALDHPHLVSSLISLGTPYFGSTTAKLFGEKFMGACAGLDDILDPEVYFGYNNRWNENYDNLYSDINAVAIGSYSSIPFLANALDNDFSGKFNTAEKVGIGAGLGALMSLKIITAVYWPLQSVAAGLISEILDICFPSSYTESVTDILFQEINFDYHPPFLSWYNDVLVPLDSQLALSNGSIEHGGWDYKGFERKTRFFNIGDDTDFTKVSSAQTPVGHNLEARDSRIISWVLGELEIGANKVSGFETLPNADGTVDIFGYTGDISQNTFFIPESVDGKTVAGISPYAFADNFYGNENVTTVYIPQSVKEIGAGAFANCTNLNTVVFDGTPQLQTIQDGAFAGCTAITAITLPSSTEMIREGAFAYSGIKTFTVPASVQLIEASSFTGCEQLERFEVASGNQFYEQRSGVLYNKGASVLVCYPANYTYNNASPTSFVAPATVSEIAINAFADNQNLTSVSLPNILSIRDGAFSNCTNLSTITAAKLNYADLNAFAGTAWLNAQASAENIELGNVLLLYSGTDTVVDLSDYQAVSDFAFADNLYVARVESGYNMVTLGSYTFYGCDNLETVLLENPNRKISIGDGTFYQETADPCDILVPLPLYEEYTSDTFWTQYIDQISVPQATVIYDTQGGNTIANGTVEYYGYFTLPTPTRSGYNFVGWFDSANAGTQITSETVWTKADTTVTLYARWQKIAYTAALYPNGGSVTPASISYSVTDTVTLPTPVRTGYTFLGWYKTPELTGTAYTQITAGTTGNLNFYAKWTPKQYTITLKTNNPAQPDNLSATVTYGQHFTLPVPSPLEGNIFNGWKYNGVEITLENGSSLQPWNIDGNVELTASWTLKKYYIKVNANGSISWITEQGFQNNQSPIEYGSSFMDNQELEAAFNPDKISMKVGHRFVYFSLTENGERFTFWQSTVPDLGPDGTVLQIYAVFVPEINFTIDYNGETTQPGVNPLVAQYGQSISLMPKSQYGYNFLGWYVADVPENSRFEGTHLAPGTLFDYSVMPDLSVGIEEDGTHIYLESRFEPIRTTISYVTGNGTVIASTPNVAYGTRVSLPVISWAGRTFQGWYTGSNGSGTKYGNSSGTMLLDWDKVTNTTLYAHWTINTYNIYYYLNGGTHSGNPSTYKVTDSTITLKNATRSGYRFMGWYTNSSFTGNRVYNIPNGSTGTKYLYAKWAKIYTLVFSTGSGSYCAPISGIAGDVITLPTSTRGGYNGRWSTINKEFGDSYTITTATNSSSTSQYTIYASWTEKSIQECYNDNTWRYEIYTYNQLNAIRTLYTHSYSPYGGGSYYYYIDVELMNDITIPGYWTPLPYDFKGNFYGNNHTISHLYISVGTEGNYGFFSLLSGTVQNLDFDNIYIYGGSANTDEYAFLNVGAIAGYLYYGNIRFCCVESGSITVKSYHNSWVGGIAGFSAGGEVYISDNNGVTVTGSGDVGGIVGCNSLSSTVNLCYNYGQVNYQYMTDNGNAGGIVGRNGISASITSCTNFGLVKYDSASSDNKELAPRMGQIVGYNYDSATFTNNKCSGSTNYDNLKTKVGGFLGIGAKNQRVYCSTGECGLNEA